MAKFLSYFGFSNTPCGIVRTSVGAILSTLLSATVSAETNSSSAETPVDLDTVTVTANRLDVARNGLSSNTGSSVYNMDPADIAALPLGDATPMNQVILQAPGVAQDSFGQLHVRGDHGNLQYRINGVIIPEGISGFGQSLDTRAANQISVLTGALPAQYGYRTAGIVDIHTKGYMPESSGNVSITGGSHRDREIGADYTGSNRSLSYSLIGSYLQNDLGIENPTAFASALHDHTEQLKGFGYLSYILDNNSRFNFMFGVSNNHFEIPNIPGLNCAVDNCFAINGINPASINSSTLDAKQNEHNQFSALSYQGHLAGSVDYQLSLFQRRTTVHYFPDAVGDLAFNGIAATIQRQDTEAGLQADASYKLNDAHTLRAGIFTSTERFMSDNEARVFSADANGTQTSDVALAIADHSGINGHVRGVYLQDEWQVTHQLTINYGARIDKVNTVVNEQQVSPRLGMVYDFSPHTHFHAGYARYFSPPPTEKIDATSIIKFANTTNALPSDANTAVKSERSHYYDIGISQEVSDHLILGLDTYYRKVQDLQDEGQFGKALIFSAFNFAEGRAYGAEFTASYNTSKFTFYTNLSYSQAKARAVETGQFNFDPNELDYIASHWVYVDHDQRLAASAGAAYTWHNTHLSADMLYGSGLRRGPANTDKLPAYTQLNVAANRDFKFQCLGILNFKLAILNLFDNHYQLRDGSGIGVGAPQYGPRRTLYLSLSKTY